ncbi:MAG: hypothetical protein HY423_02310 [Candidatus Lambdaproteobacteria bacterium]|nr:hypothetical protein [Candidatus Lambdaproteobacteria bacterium]
MDYRCISADCHIVWPDSQACIRKQFGHLPADVPRKMTCANVGKFYGLIPA